MVLLIIKMKMCCKQHPLYSILKNEKKKDKVESNFRKYETDEKVE